jgi:methionyl-tRNA formyltransferase
MQPRWVRRIMEDVTGSSFCRLVLIVKNNSGELTEPKFTQRLWQRRNQLLYGIYTKLDNRFSRVSPDALELVDVSDLCEGIDVLTVSPIMKKFSDALQDEDLKKINEHKLDVALRFGFRILRGKVLETAAHGVWSYHHDDSLLYRGGPPGFWEVMKDDAVTGSVLQILTEELDNGRVIYRSWAPTTNRFSVKKNNNNYYWKSSAFVTRKLKELHGEQRVVVNNQLASASPQPYCCRLYKIPGNREMLSLSLNLSRRAAKRTIEKLAYSETWSLAYRFKTSEQDVNDSFHRYRFLVPPKGRFWADPFPIKVGEKYFVFFEDFVYREGKANISVIEIAKDGTLSEPVRALETDFHLSYPFIFKWQEALYMIPETGANNTVELYRCVSFPLKWEKQAVLLEANNPSDATLFEIDGTWWMFVNIEERGVTVNWEELHLFHSASPLGPWHPHRRNPVKSDVRNSRPAGHLFFQNGQLFRPAQDCSKRYGYATSINRVVTLSDEEYREEEVAKIVPEWAKEVIGTHTINSAGDLTVIDCLLKKRKLF